MSELIDDIRSLIPSKRGKGRLGPAKKREAISAGQSVGRRGAIASTTSTGRGIASPRVETLSKRTYHPEYTVRSSDGFYAFVWQDVASVTFADAAAAITTDQYGDPNA